MRVNLDANILIDWLSGELLDEEFDQIIQNDDICLTPLTIHIAWYFFEEGRIRCTKAELKEVIGACEILVMDKATYSTALLISKEEDIEGGMQVACCLNNNVNMIVTSDSGLFAKYYKRIQIKYIQ